MDIKDYFGVIGIATLLVSIILIPVYLFEEQDFMFQMKCHQAGGRYDYKSQVGWYCNFLPPLDNQQ